MADFAVDEIAWVETVINVFLDAGNAQAKALFVVVDQATANNVRASRVEDLAVGRPCLSVSTAPKMRFDGDAFVGQLAHFVALSERVQRGTWWPDLGLLDCRSN